MLLANLVRELDKKFLVNSIPADKPFSIVLPQIYGTKNYDWKKYFEKFFLKNFHGLMLRNGERVDLVVGTVFLDEGVLRKIIKKKAKNIMIFSHHPMGDETAGRGFLPLSEDILKVLQKKNISVYSLHTPLDIHSEVSTTLDLCRACEIAPLERFARDLNGWAGIIGTIKEPMVFEGFVDRIQRIADVSKVNYIKNSDNVYTIGVIPGGGTSIELIEEASKNGCDTYLTGEYFNKLQIPFGQIERDEFNAKISKQRVNLIEISHYISERFVFLSGLKNLFEEKYGLGYEFLEQDDPWY